MMPDTAVYQPDDPVEPAGVEGDVPLLPRSSWDAAATGHDAQGEVNRRSRLLALAAVCSLSVGSHFAIYLLGPLKSRLHREMGTSNSQFSLLIASFNLNSTWTPLVAGLFVSRFGTSSSSVATTGCILLGQVVLFIGVITEHLVTMTLGLFVFGIGLTPLSVVQETLLSHLSPGKHLGLSLALGLISGKAASFVSSLVSLPLAEASGDTVPFGIAVILCAGGFVANAARLIFGWGGGAAVVSEKGRVGWDAVGDLGDVFWVYIGMNVLSGAIWSPFIQLSANLVQTRYALSETLASEFASILLAGAIVLYPITGLVTDRLDPSNPKAALILFVHSSVLSLLGYTYLLLPPSLTHSPWPGMTLFALGNGMSTLLMVILVPRLLPRRLVPLGLGLHKSMEMASSSMTQTLAGLWLDHARGQGEFTAGQRLIAAFWGINTMQLACGGVLWAMTRGTRSQYEPIPISLDDQEERPGETSIGLATTPREKRRSKGFFAGSLGYIGLVWAVFLGTAWSKL